MGSKHCIVIVTYGNNAMLVTLLHMAIKRFEMLYVGV